MRTRLFYGGLLVIAISLVFGSPSYCAGELGIQPPADWTVGGPINVLSGTSRTISGVLPGNWKEDDEFTVQSGGIVYGKCANIVLFNADGNAYKFQISLNGPLISSSSSKTIPVSSLSYILTYVYMYYGNPNPNNGPGKASYTQKYVPFSFAPTTLYTSTIPESGSGVQGQFQFKYAVQVPNDQPPGTYSGTINYQVVNASSGATINSGTANINIVVGSEFTLSVDRGTADFETMKPGETKDNVPPEGVIITSMTNDGNPWFLKISDINPLSAGPYIIPNSGLTWYGWTDGKGTWYGNGTNAITLVPSLMYASGATETNNLPNGTNNHLKLKLTIPPGQPGGRYFSTIQLTMTE